MCWFLCQIYVWWLWKGCVSPILLRAQKSTSSLFNFTHSLNSALIELLSLPLQVINYCSKSSCPVKPSIKTPDTSMICNMHQNVTKLFPLLPKVVFNFFIFPIIFPFVSNFWPSRQNCFLTYRDCYAVQLPVILYGDMQEKYFIGQKKPTVTSSHCLWINVIIVHVNWMRIGTFALLIEKESYL